MPEGHLVSAPPLCPPCSAPQGQAESGGMVLAAYAGPVRPAAALRVSVFICVYEFCRGNVCGLRSQRWWMLAGSPPRH